MASQIKPPAQQLLAHYQTVFVSQATAVAAQYEAERSESELMQHLRDMSGGSYLQPVDLKAEQDTLTRSSIDAHIKKMQAAQIDSMSAEQLVGLQQTSQHDYAKRKVQVSVLMPDKQPIESVWFDQRTGYRTSINKNQFINGIISEVLLDKNVLILKPTAGRRLLNSNLQNYVVYIIDPDTLRPMVDLSLR